MLALLGTIVGLFGSIIPEFLKFWNNKEDHKHEVEMARIQMEAAKLQGDIKLAELNATADIEEVKALYASAEQKITGNKILDGFVSLYNSSVRPTITYGFFILYALVKASMFYAHLQAGWDWQLIAGQIWNQEDFAVFSTILAFWFGGRFMKYSLGRIGNGKNGK